MEGWVCVSNHYSIAAPLRRPRAFDKSADYFRIEFPFGNLDSGVQCFGVVVRQNWNFTLRDDRPVIDLLIDEMDGATRDFFARSKRL